MIWEAGVVQHNNQQEVRTFRQGVGECGCLGCGKDGGKVWGVLQPVPQVNGGRGHSLRGNGG